jgi:hypothetical protein
MIITDAGFRSTWFDRVTEHHWPWIGRIRGKDMIRMADGPWRRCTEVFLDATARNQTFPDALYVRSHPTAIDHEGKQRASPAHADGPTIPLPHLAQSGQECA